MQRSDNILAPRATVIAGGRASAGVLRIPVTTTADTFVIPSAFSDKLVRIYAEGCNVDFLCGISTTAVVYGTQSAVDAGTKVVTVDATTGGRCTDGVVRDFRIPPDSVATHIAHDASATGSLVIELAE